MGKYGVNPNDVVYVVSQAVYFQLLEDAEFQDANLVGDLATKLSGEIGQVFGTRVLMCDEFPAQAANGFGAIAVYARNYVMPRTTWCDFRVRLRSCESAQSACCFTKNWFHRSNRWCYFQVGVQIQS